MINLKICDVCGTFNLKENNYCTHCGNELIIEHVCPYCGVSNLDDATLCIKCKKRINPIRIDDFDTLFAEVNEDLLSDAEISDLDYNQLLKRIFLRAEYIRFHGENPKDKILSLASIFTQCKTKSRGYERGFMFLGNSIHYDDRLDDSVQIATIIHELAHYFLFTIIESLLCEILKVETSSTLRSFVWYFLTIPDLKIMNEYCAHTVEGRFLPYGYQNYGSFNTLIENMDMDDDSIKTMMMLGNTFANEIIVYLEKYIDDSFRKEIKLQYKRDMKSPKYDSIFIETSDCFSVDVKNRLIIERLGDVFKGACEAETREELELIKEGIEID